jgi:serine protease Do
MKKLLFAFLPWLFTAFSYKVMAQDEKPKNDKKESQEIIIRQNGDKDAEIVVQIKGDKVLINGKPLAEFKDDEITVNKRKVIVRDGNKFKFDGGDLGSGSFSWSNDDAKGRAFLGVNTEKTEGGAKITEITKESAAEKAGLEKGDIILKLDDRKIDGPQSLYDAVTSKKPKDEVKVYIKKNGKEKTVKATLQEKKDYAKSYSYSMPDGSFKTFTMPSVPAGPDMRGWNGMDPEDMVISPDIANGGMNDFNFFPRRQKLGLKIQDTEDGNGVKVLEVADSSAAATAGLKKDDVISEIGGEKVSNTDEAREQLHENSEKSAYKIKARRNGTEMSFDIKIPKKLKTANL